MTAAVELQALTDAELDQALVAATAAARALEEERRRRILLDAYPVGALLEYRNGDTRKLRGRVLAQGVRYDREIRYQVRNIRQDGTEGERRWIGSYEAPVMLQEVYQEPGSE